MSVMKTSVFFLNVQTSTNRLLNMLQECIHVGYQPNFS